MRPLDPLSSIKIKLGALIVAAIAVTVVVHSIGLRARMPLVVIGAISALLALTVVHFLARGMTSPLRQMAEAARAMAKGEYGRRVTATSRDEVGELARAFNSMASELAEVDRMRRDLVANVSHELRTPITALQAVLENLMDGVGTPDPETVRTIYNQVERLGRLVEQLLDLSRLESGVVPLHRAAFEIKGLIQQAVGESALAANGVKVSFDVDPPDLRVDGDPERVHQVVANLLENAIRYSPPGGKVGVAAVAAMDRVRVEVVDQGPGIPEGERQRVFERFYRTDESRSGDSGTGLGLSIARWIVDLHGGDIWAEQAEPSGCRMIVTLPRARPHAASSS